MIKITLPGEYIDLNAYLKGINYNRFAGNAIKQAETSRVYYECKEQRIPSVRKYPVEIEFKWYSKNRRKDIDGVAFSKKFVLDGLVEAGVIKNDSRKFVSGFSDKFYIDSKNPRVEIEIRHQPSYQ